MTHEPDGLGRRLRQVRLDLYGENGGPMLAEALRLPVRTWINYEQGIAVPALVVLRFIELTGTCPHWLLTGELPRYREMGRDPCPNPLASSQ